MCALSWHRSVLDMVFVVKRDVNGRWMGHSTYYSFSTCALVVLEQREHVISGLWRLAYFTKHSDFQLGSFCCKQQDFILSLLERRNNSKSERLTFHLLSHHLTPLGLATARTGTKIKPEAWNSVRFGVGWGQTLEPSVLSRHVGRRQVRREWLVLELVHSYRTQAC